MFDKAFFLLCMIITFYITIRALQKFQYSDSTLSSFIDQFRLGYIQDIVAFDITNTNTKECPPGYTDMLTYSWPGTNQGCACPDITNPNKYTFTLTVCSPDSLKNNCINIDETSSQPLRNWKNIRFCYARSMTSYIDLLQSSNIIPSSEATSCSNATHRICGEIDNLNNWLCWENELNCPVTDIILTSNTTEIEEYKTTNTNYTLSEFTSDTSKLFLLVTHEANIPNKILTQFKIHQTQPCLNGNKAPQNELLYNWMKNKFDLSCEKYPNNTEIIDPLYTIIDKDSVLSYSLTNNISESINSVASWLGVNLNNLFIYLYGKRYPGWSFHCMKIDNDTFFNFLELSNVLNKLSTYTIIHAFWIIFILLAIGVCSFYFMDNFEKLFYLFILGFIVLNWIYPIQVISNVNWIINNLSGENGEYCGDWSLNILLVGIINVCISLLYSYVSLLFIIGICWCVYLYILQSFIKPTIKEVQERLLQMRQFN